jgi:hypothetical protein
VEEPAVSFSWKISSSYYATKACPDTNQGPENPGLKSETWATHSTIRPLHFLRQAATHLTVVFAVDWVFPFPSGFALLTFAVLVIVVPALAVTFT